MNPWIIYLPLAGCVLGVLCLLAAMKANRRKRLLENSPTSTTTGVFIGLVELKGTAESEAPLRSYLAGVPCVHYSWDVSEHWSRTVTENYTDSEGNSKTRTRHESGWASVASGGELSPFYLKDDHGVILVRPQGATLEPMQVFSEQCTPVDSLYYEKGPAGAVSHSDFRRSFTETAIPLHRQLYVMGQSRLRDDIVAPEIAADAAASLFLISTRDETQIAGGYQLAIYLWWGFGLVLWAGSWAVGPAASGEIEPGGNPAWVKPLGMAALGYISVTVVGWTWTVYNSMVQLRQRVRQGWSQIDVQLKRRHDLIPSLAAIVSGMSAHEREVQTAVAGLRTQLQATPPGEVGPDYRAHAKTLIALAEKYPQLTANDSFLKLQQELTETENRVALARGYFNEIATYYNTRLEVVPDRFVAGLAGMEVQPLMRAEDFERATVNVKFDPGA